MTRRLLLVEDDVAAARAMEALLKRRGWAVTHAPDLARARESLAAPAAPAAVILDLGLPDGDGMGLLETIAAEHGGIPVMVLTGERSVERAVTAMRLGAADYLPKPVDPRHLDLAMTRLERAVADRDRLAALRGQLKSEGRFEGLVGRSAPMLAVYGLVEKVAPSLMPVFITGESGTGKELLASAVHTLSGRRGGPFVAINCGAISPQLAESELFGHVRGAFTGADRARRGVFEEADGGTLFLDELPEMSMEMQVKLLRVLETGRIRPVGAQKDREVDVRVVSATNRDPEEAIAEGRLREDLYFRLAGFPVHLPPLRERREDLPLLARHLLARLAEREGREAPALSAEALEALTGHAFPGNVRELRHLLGRAAVLAGAGPITPAHLGGLAPAKPAPRQERPAPSAPAPVEGAVTLPIGTTLREAERALAEATLAHHGGHRERSARDLGVSLKTLYNKLRAWSEAP